MDKVYLCKENIEIYAECFGVREIKKGSKWKIEYFCDDGSVRLTNVHCLEPDFYISYFALKDFFLVVEND